MNALCRTRPAQWWETGDDGNRLALLLCRVCPVRPECEGGDPEPVGVIRAGVAYGDRGEALALCACGYPIVRVSGRAGRMCHRCRGPARQRAPRLNRKPSPSAPRRRGKGAGRPDPAAVERLLRGEKPVKVRQVDEAEAITQLAAAGLGNRAIADRLGKSTQAIARRRQRMVHKLSTACEVAA